MTTETVNMPMNWTAAAGIIAIALEAGTSQGRKSAREELANMAKAADRWNAHAAALVELVTSARFAAESLEVYGEAPQTLADLRAALVPFAELVPVPQPEPAPAKNKTVSLGKRGAVYVVTFDEFDTVDTITRNGSPLLSTHRDARAILAKADGIRCRVYAPAGFVFLRGSEG